MNKTSDVLIVGAGIMGCAAAYYLAKRGVKARVLEKGDIACGASGRNGTAVVCSSREKGDMPLAMYGIRNLWPTLQEELEADIEFSLDGNLKVGVTDADRAALEKEVAHSRALGVQDIRMISGEEARERLPILSPEITCAKFCPSDGHDNPMRTTLAYYRKARYLGAEFVTGAKVVELRKYRGRIRAAVTEDGDVYEADAVILCAGMPSLGLMHTVGLTIPMTEKFCEMVITESVRQICDPFPFTHTARESWYIKQQRNGTLLVGCMTPYLTYDADYKKPVNTLPLIPWDIHSLLRYMPALSGVKVVRAWCGSLDKSWDDLPTVSRVEEVPGLILACGFTGDGFALGPSVGYVLAQLAVGEEPVVPIDALCYSRFDVPPMPEMAAR